MLLAALRPSIATPRSIAFDATRPLQQLSDLDLDHDGRLTRADARRLEGAARTLRWWGGDAAGARHLRWAARQARIGAALEVPPTSGATIAGALPMGLAGSLDGAALVDGIHALDRAPLRRMSAMGVRPVATFDYDGTSAQGDVLVPVLRALAARRMLSKQGGDRFAPLAQRVDELLGGGTTVMATGDPNDSALHVTSQLPELFERSGLEAERRALVSDVFYATAASMEGVRVADARRLVRELAVRGDEELGIPPLRSLVHDPSAATGDSMRDVVSALRGRGIDPWVVTYGFDWIATELVPLSLGIPARNVVAWPAETRWGRFTGRVPAELDKHDMVRDAIGVPPVMAFGDSASDVPMLDLAVARGIIVNPGAALRERNARGGSAWSEVDMRPSDR